MNRNRPPIKSATFSRKTLGFGVSRLYESLMADSAIQVHAFRGRQAAAAWLQVPVFALAPPA